MNERSIAVWREAVYARFPIVDGTGNERALLAAAVHATAALLRGRVSTLVFCSAGLSRSLCVAAAAVCLVTGRSPSECLRIAASSGPADVSPALWGAVLDAAGLAGSGE